MLFAATLIGFLGVGALLATNHPGAALKTTNYLFFLLLVAVLWKLVKHEAD